MYLDLEDFDIDKNAFDEYLGKGSLSTGVPSNDDINHILSQPGYYYTTGIFDPSQVLALDKDANEGFQHLLG